ncbi:MAG: methyltransferase [Muribaculaceae bacterium]|nr:methyltransferase [Muribaculaceae bacterium]
MFRFKHFDVSHSQSSMKVGVDAVLLGAWTRNYGRDIIDIGTGCGVISLMLAQRFPEAFIDAIDIDLPSVEESGVNFANSPWKDRLKVWLAEFPKDLKTLNKQYDLVVSNPPFFHSGIENPSTSRERARHQDKLSVFSLLEYAPEILKETGTLAMIFPLEFIEKVKESAIYKGLRPKRICRIKNREDKAAKRVMIEFQKSVNSELKEEDLTLFNGIYPTEAYKNLCGDFYLKF